MRSLPVKGSNYVQWNSWQIYTWDLCRLDGHCHNTAIPVRFASAEMFTENKADETFHVSYAYLYSMVGWRDIDRTYKCVSEWRFFLVKSCIYPFILSCFWQPYECVTGLSKVFWVVVSRYVCYSVCFSIFGKNSKVKFLIFSSWVVSFVVGSLWVVLRSSSVVWRSWWIVVGRCGSLWVVVDRCGSFLVLVTTGYMPCSREGS